MKLQHLFIKLKMYLLGTYKYKYSNYLCMNYYELL